jgi:hypothetical protein
VNKFHPYANAAVHAFRAVDRDDVRMTHPGQQAPLFNARRRACIVFCLFAPQNLERNFAIEPAVPGTIDIAGRAGTDVFDDFQRTPGVAACDVCHVRDESEFGKKLAILVGGQGLRGRFPVHGCAIGKRHSHVEEWFLMRHV